MAKKDFSEWAHLYKEYKTINYKKLENKLDLYDYNYSENGQNIKIKIDYSLQMEVDFSKNGKIKITDKLGKWNLLNFETTPKTKVINL